MSSKDKTEKSMAPLRKCPFCGKEAISEDHGDNGWFMGCINVEGCDFVPSAWFDSEKQAIEEWNSCGES